MPGAGATHARGKAATDRRAGLSGGDPPVLPGAGRGRSHPQEGELAGEGQSDAGAAVQFLGRRGGQLIRMYYSDQSVGMTISLTDTCPNGCGVYRGPGWWKASDLPSDLASPGNHLRIINTSA